MQDGGKIGALAFCYAVGTGGLAVRLLGNHPVDDGAGPGLRRAPVGVFDGLNLDAAQAGQHQIAPVLVAHRLLQQAFDQPPLLRGGRAIVFPVGALDALQLRHTGQDFVIDGEGLGWGGFGGLLRVESGLGARLLCLGEGRSLGRLTGGRRHPLELLLELVPGRRLRGLDRAGRRLAVAIGWIGPGGGGGC